VRRAAASLAMADHPAVRACRAVIAGKSRSFALASRLLAREAEAGAVVVYAYCRGVDDAIDLAPPAARPAALDRLEAELDAIYAGAATGDVVQDAFVEVVRRARIPRRYPAELIAGMAMDVAGARYRSLDDLRLYAFRVAGTVGLMMCHVLGVSDERALEHAVHLGIAMQLTNIGRDVAEDWSTGRLYLPDDLLARHGLGDLRAALGGPLPAAAREPLRAAVAELLAVAARYYASGDAGLCYLGWREALAVRTARHIYAAIGDALAGRGHDVLAGRAVVPGLAKARLVAIAGQASVAEIGLRLRRRERHAAPARELAFPADVAAL
jgi:phytoene synthase